MNSQHKTGLKSLNVNTDPKDSPFCVCFLLVSAHSAILSHVHLEEEELFSSTWPALAQTPSHSCVQPLITDTNLSFPFFNSLPRCAGEGPKKGQFRGSVGVI